MSTIDVDARGLMCPLPVIRLAQAARSAATGDEYVLVATDPAARFDVPAWARMRGHAVVAIDDAGGELVITVRIG